MDRTVSAAFWNNTGLQYDANGNWTQVTGSGADSYAVNSLNQYTSDAVTGGMGYDPKGNLTSAAGWAYTYDAQNRLTTMQGPGMTITMTYDPLNRVITRNINGAVTQNVWEGWNLIEEHRPDWSLQRCYLQGANQNEMVAAFDGNVYSNHWYWQDGRGNTSHITGDNAYLLERYTYDLSGAPKFYDEWDNERFGGSVYDTRFLFAGSQYLPETGLYDMRNRFYSPTLNRFLQTDPIGFAGDALNLYRYCGDDPVDRTDPMGLEDDGYIHLTLGEQHLLQQARASVEKPAMKWIQLPGRGYRQVPVTSSQSVLRRGNELRLSGITEGSLERREGPPGSPQQWVQVERYSVPRGWKAVVTTHKHWNATGYGESEWSGPDRTEARKRTMIERTDESQPGVYKRLVPQKNGPSYKEENFDHPIGPPKTPSSSSSNNSSGPSAAEVDAANQSTGVPSLGAEAVNYVNGRL